MNTSTILRLALVSSLLTTLVIGQAAVAQSTEPDCNVVAVIEHQKEHAQELADFVDEAKTDLDAALATLYRTAIAYQALAVECGFTESLAVEAAHQVEHSGLVDIDTDAHTEGDTHVDAHSEAEEAEMLDAARTIGDPEQGRVLFNTVRPEVSFACATCHRVDSTETLVGPGLLGINSHSGNHDETTINPTSDGMSGMNMGEATATPDGMSGMNMGEATATPDGMSGMNMGEATAEAEHEQTLEQKVEFLRTSIINPSASVMTGFPDNLMPKVYGTIFTEEEINDLIAYLLTLN